MESPGRTIIPTPELSSTLMVVLGFTTLFLVYFSVRFGLNDPPSATGDEPSYDSLGWQIHLGNGFREDFQDPVFRLPYDNAAVRSPVPMSLATVQPGTVTYRPPLFPVLIAGTDWLFGRQFWAVRTLNVLLLTASGGLLFRFLLQRYGRPTAICSAGLFFLADVRVRLYARAVLTEALAVFLMTLVTLLILRLLETRRLRYAAGLGVAFGLAMLNRSAFLLWLPGLTLLLICGLMFLRPCPGERDSHSVCRSELYRACGLSGVFLLTSIVVYLPWGIRNVQTLGRLMPTGTQGLMELSAAFSDEAYQRQGIWFNLQNRGFYVDVDRPSMTRIEQEIARADYSRQQAHEWIQANPGKVLTLGAYKIFHEYRPRNTAEWLIWICVLTGMVTTIRLPSTRVFIALHVVNALTIAATWSVEGRFVVPLLFSIHVMAARGLRVMMSRAWIMYRSFRLHAE